MSLQKHGACMADLAMDLEEELIEQLRALPCTKKIFLETRDEIIDYYKDKYGVAEDYAGTEAWKSHIIADLMAQTGKSRNTVAREFQYDRRVGAERYRVTKPSPATKAKYKQLGRKLPPRYIAPDDGYNITYIGGIRISKKCEHRSFSVVISGAAAQELLETGELWILYAAYWEGEEDNPAEGPCEGVEIIAGCVSIPEPEPEPEPPPKKKKKGKKKP